MHFKCWQGRARQESGLWGIFRKKTGLSSASPRPMGGSRVGTRGAPVSSPHMAQPKGTQQLFKEFLGCPVGQDGVGGGFGGSRHGTLCSSTATAVRDVRRAGGQWGPPRLGQEWLLPPSPPNGSSAPPGGHSVCGCRGAGGEGRGGSFLVITPRPSQPGSWREPGGTQLKLSMVLP